MRISSLRIVILSGAICSGKSALARQLAERYGARVIKTRELILAARPKTKEDRQALQRAGDALDREDDGEWVRTALAQTVDKYASGNVPSGLFVVDSARILGRASDWRILQTIDLKG